MLIHQSIRQPDRFIPHRSNPANTHPDAQLRQYQSQPNSSYSELVKSTLFYNLQTKVINYKISQTSKYQEQSKVGQFEGAKLRKQIDSPVKVLDVPGIRDDFYQSVLDWSERGPLGVALDNQVFIYTPQNLVALCRSPFNSYVSSIKMEDLIGAVGLSNGTIEIYDLERGVIARTLIGHSGRVAALTFMEGSLLSGSKDRAIFCHDLRQKNHIVSRHERHKGEVCSIKQKSKSQKIFASGSADGSAMIWDLRLGLIQQLKGHKGAVKALSWCPWRGGMLATGGGGSQKTIKLWNTTNSKLLTTTVVGSQVSGMVWNSEVKGLISSHGFSKNQIKIWGLQTNGGGGCWLDCKVNFAAHTQRVLSLVQSHDQGYLCTVGAEQNLKFWCVRDTGANPFKNEQRIERSSNQHRL